MASGNNSVSASATVSASADLAVGGSGPATIAAGNNITYTITLANNGPSDAQNVALTDATPAGATFVSRNQGSGPQFSCTSPPVGSTGTIVCTIATLASGATASFTIVDSVNPAGSGGTIMNTATVTSTTSDATPGNNSVNAATMVSAGAVELTITNAPSAPPYQTGLPIAYAIVVSNSGPAAAADVVVTDIIPLGTTFNAVTATQGSCNGTSTVICSLGTLASGSSATISLVLTLPATPGPLSNTASVTSSNPDTNPANNSSTPMVSVIAAAAIPAVSPLVLLLLALTMTLLGVTRLRS
jgi:uncharacterized repeat protein (TIGR01451 family)